MTISFINAKILLEKEPKWYYLISDLPNIFNDIKAPTSKIIEDWVYKSFEEGKLKNLYSLEGDKMETITQEIWQFHCRTKKVNRELYNNSLTTQKPVSDDYYESCQLYWIPKLYIFIGDLIDILKKNIHKDYASELSDLLKEISEHKNLDEPLKSLLKIKDKQKENQQQTNKKYQEIIDLYKQYSGEYQEENDTQIAKRICVNIKKSNNAEGIRKIVNDCRKKEIIDHFDEYTNNCPIYNIEEFLEQTEFESVLLTDNAFDNYIKDKGLVGIYENGKLARFYKLDDSIFELISKKTKYKFDQVKNIIEKHLLPPKIKAIKKNISLPKI